MPDVQPARGTGGAPRIACSLDGALLYTDSRGQALPGVGKQLPWGQQGEWEGIALCLGAQLPILCSGTV